MSRLSHMSRMSHRLHRRIRQNLTRRGPNQHVTPRWNAEKQSCELIWDDDTDHPLGVQEVSQKALEPLFFDTDQ